MTDKTTSDESDRRSDADSDRNEGNEASRGTGARATQVPSPLITAIEIENFKGIGRPMRIDLRPITLLFGNNSAGKSTVLHALCYAHEILSYGNVDAHKTGLGGDRIDLGGFRNFVHAHDSTRTVRLRFELHLGNWRIPQELEDKLIPPLDGTDDTADSSWLFSDPSERPVSGWIELQVELRDEQPALASYELGVNDALVGRLQPRRPAGVALEFNRAHPILEGTLRRPGVAPLHDPKRRAESGQTDTRVDPVQEATGTDNGNGQQSHIEVLGLSSPLPHWNDILVLEDHKQWSDDGYYRTDFTAMASVLFVGIGRALRDELARCRYIGPVRDIHPQTRIASSARYRALEALGADVTPSPATVFKPQSADPESWADGAAAWTYLHTSVRRHLIEDVSDWIAREDRLNTGYALRARSVVTIYEEDTQFVSAIREYHQLRQTHGNAEGSVDLARWARSAAEAIVDKAGPDYKQAALEHCDRLRAIFSGAAAGTPVNGLLRNAVRGLEELERRESIDVETGMRREAERNLRLAEDLHRLLTWSVRDIESQITKSGGGLVDSSETLTSAYCRRLNDLLPRWESNAPLWDLPHRYHRWTSRDAALRRYVSGSRNKDTQAGRSSRSRRRLRRGRTVAQRVPEGDQATVGSAGREYRRLATLVTKMEGRDLTSPEFEELAAAILAHPAQREIELVTTNELPVRVADVGVGISQVLPVVVAALDTERPGITAIEQPELHLHPRMQVELGDLFAQPVDDGRVFLLENHSEHLMLRLLRRIEETHTGELAEGKPALRPDQVSVIFVEQVDGEIRATPLRINETGEFIDRWPHGFFRERAAELF